MKKFLSKKMMLLPPFEPFSMLFTENGTFEKPKHCKKLTVKVIGAGGHGGAADGAVLQVDLHLNGGIAAAVEHLATVDVQNIAHVVSLSLGNGLNAWRHGLHATAARRFIS